MSPNRRCEACIKEDIACIYVKYVKGVVTKVGGSFDGEKFTKTKGENEVVEVNEKHWQLLERGS